MRVDERRPIAHPFGADTFCNQLLPELDCLPLPVVLVTHADLPAFVIIQDGEIDGRGDGSFVILLGRTHVDHGTLISEDILIVVYDMNRQSFSQPNRLKVWGR